MLRFARVSAVFSVVSGPAVAFALASSLIAGCDDKTATTTPPAPAKDAPTKVTEPPKPAAVGDPAPLVKPGDGVLTGTVKLDGKAPEMPELNRGADAFCAKDKMKDEEVVVGSKGELKNVVVRIMGGPAMAGPDTAVELTQDRCMYKPRVAGLVAGQTLKIKNADKTLHNVHTYKGTSTIFNVAQIADGAPLEKKFNESGVLIKFKCDVHQWMAGWVWVQNNPLFAVTGDDGKFEIKGIPDGTYDVEAWHERLPLQKGKITVAGGKPATWDVTFTAP